LKRREFLGVLEDVYITRSRDKGIVTPGGQVVSENEKSLAEASAKCFAGAQVVADQIAVIPVGIEKEPKAANADLDEGIEKNLDAALIQNKLRQHVKFEVKSGVVTLSGEVNSQHKRDRAETGATRVPSVKQVVNDLHAKKPESQLFAIGPARLILYEGGRAVVFRIALPQTTEVNSQTQRQLPT
jgi:osmotically-inducible protein OsmY